MSLPILILIILTRCVMAENYFAKSLSVMKKNLSDFFYIDEYLQTLKCIGKKIDKLKRGLKHFFGEITNEKRSENVQTNIARISETNNKLITPVIESETRMSALGMIAFHGYQAEKHSIQTRDGFVLEIHRILSVSPKTVNGKEKLALLHHGFMGTSEDWLLLGPGRALPYLLSDAGFDVWLTNARGNKYTRFGNGDSTTYIEPSMFWDFSFHEMGYNDLSAVIDYIQRRNKNELEINFVGHSMGGTALFVLLSTLPRYNEVLYSATFLAPLAFMHQIKGPFKLLAEFYKKNDRRSFNFLGENEFMSMQNFPTEFIEKFCVGSRELCSDPLLFLADGGNSKHDPDLLGLIMNRTLGGTSTKTIIHYLQLINSGTFQHFDYGATENLKRHGVLSTPIYDIRQISLPIYLFTSQNDMLCTTSNIQILKNSLRSVMSHQIINMSDFSHTDFVWGVNATSLVYYPLLKLLGN